MTTRAATAYLAVPPADQAAPGLALPDRATRFEMPSRQPTVFERLPVEVPVPGVSREITVKIASEREEWEEAFQLVAANYRARGYEAASAKPLRFSPFHALPDTMTLVAKHAGHVVATFSIVLDNVMLGLPMETIYGEEIATLRGQGRRMLETTSLADTGLSVREFMQVFVAMIRLGMQHHQARGGDTFVITVNPKHRSFYSRVLGFQPLGPCRSYACVQDAPAEAFWVDQALMAQNAPRMHDEIFNSPLPPDALAGTKMPRHLVRYFDGRSSMGNAKTIETIFDYVDHYGSARRW
jgi:hypothetical protein